MKNRSGLFLIITNHVKNTIYFLTAILLITSCKPDVENKEQMLFDKFFEPLAIPKNLYELGASQTDIAFRIYHQKDYKEAIVNFKYALLDNPNNNKLKLYLGISFLKMKDIRQAKRLFANIIDHGKEEYKEIASWYLALALLNEDKASAKILLSQLFSSKSYGSQAKELHSLI